MTILYKGLARDMPESFAPPKRRRASVAMPAAAVVALAALAWVLSRAVPTILAWWGWWL